MTNADRVKSATSGPLAAGKFRFVIEGLGEGRSVVDFDYNPHFVEPVVITMSDRPKQVEVLWSKPMNADNFWLFVVPVNTTNFLDDLMPVTQNKYLQQRLVLSKSDFAPGTYRCAVRANEMLKSSAISGFSSESWGISEIVFNVP